MAKGGPSMVALLGLLAVAGYQNREKLGEMMNGRPPLDSDPDRSDRDRVEHGGLGGMVGNLGQTGAAAGGLMGALSEMFDRFTQPQQQAKAQSWLRQGPNEPLAPEELESALDEETITELVEKTGLSRAELLSRLSATLPEAIDQVTPDGSFPPLQMREPRSI